MNSKNIPEQFKPLPEIARSTCFGCGPGNVAGLKMHFYSDNKSVISFVKVPEQFCGWENIVHGGIISTILDELMGWTAIFLLKKATLTKSITVDFLKPVFVNQELFVQGELVDMASEQHAVIRARMYNQDEEICAEGRGTFRVFDMDEAIQRGLLEENILLEMQKKLAG